MSHLSFQDRVMLQTNFGVVLCSSKTRMGEPFFHYVMADKNNIEKLHDAYERGDYIDFSSYGEILLSGWGEKPPPEYDIIIHDYFKDVD